MALGLESRLRMRLSPSNSALAESSNAWPFERTSGFCASVYSESLPDLLSQANST